MLKATGHFEGRPVLLIGLSFGNLRKFLAEPLDTYIRIPAAEMGLSHDVILFSGATEQQMAAQVGKGMMPPGKETKG
jgi:hypothetical protein